MSLHQAFLPTCVTPVEADVNAVRILDGCQRCATKSEHDQEHGKHGEPVSLRVKLTFGFVKGDVHLAPVLLNFIVQIERLL